MSIREYVFIFEDVGTVKRIPFAKWCRIRTGDEKIKHYSNQAIHVAYAYILIKNRKPDYCPRIDGAVYYFDKSGRVIEHSHYFDLLQDADEEAGGVISLQHRKKKKDVAKKNHWKLNSQQIQAVIESVW